MKARCKKGMHEYVDTSVQFNTLTNGTLIFKKDVKCRFCGKIKPKR